MRATGATGATWARAVLGLAGGAAIALAGCRLQEVTLAAPADVVVAEVVLQAGAAQQFGLLHRSVGGATLTVPGATMQLTLPGGGVVSFAAAAGSKCVDASSAFSPDTVGSCYATAAFAATVLPGGTYALSIRTADGRRLSGTTTVPGSFRLTRPPGLSQCALAAFTLLPLAWTRSDGAWVYLSETRLTHVRRALDPATLDDRTLDVTGLSISAEDTTIVFPSEFGLFDRADSADAVVLRALQRGLPTGVTATVSVAAADRNYVQWVRRSGFNPSGAVQIPSLEGDGTGVLGSLVPLRFDLTSSTSTLPPCT